MIVDFHTHIYPDKIAEKTVSFLLSKINLPDKQAFTEGTAKSLIYSMKESKVDLSVVLPVVTKPSQFESINRFAAEQNNRKELECFGGIHPDNEDVQEKLISIKKSGLKGIKLHPDYQNCFIDDKRYINIIDMCAQIGLKVVIHAGIDVGLPQTVHCTPEKVLTMLREVRAEKYSPFITLAHMGGWMMQEDVKKFLCAKNVFFDTGYCLDKYEPSDILEIINLHGTDKILFATDSPWGEPKRYIQILDSLNLSDREKELIFYKNALGLLDMSEEDLNNK